ncbi:MAG: AI-2E family transporter [Verrucomicrobiota bacterium]
MSDAQGKQGWGEGLDKGFVRRLLAVVGVVALAALAAVIVWELLNILLLAFGGVMAAVLFHFLATKLSGLTRLPYQAAVLVVFLGLITFLGVIIGLTGPVMSSQVNAISEELPRYLERSKNQIAELPLGDQLVFEIDRLIQSENGSISLSWEQFSRISGPLLGIFGTTLGTVVSILLIFLLGLYLAIEPRMYVAGILHLVPLGHRPRAQEVLDRMYANLVYWFFGQLVSLTLIGVGMTIGLVLLGVPLPVFLGLLTAVLSFIPNLGPTLAAVPVLLLALSVSPWTALYTLIFIIALQNLEGIFVTPTVLRRAVQLPPALLIVVQISLATLAGFLGLLLATPLLVCVIVLVQMLYVRDVLGEEMPGTARRGLQASG